MEETIISPVELPETVEVVDIQFRTGQKVYYFAPDGHTVKTGDHVIIDTARGPEFGICAGGNHQIPSKDVVAPLRSVLRLATAEDERIVARNRAEEKRAYESCLQKIADHNLDMQLVSAEFAFDGSKILFFFTADERVDFRELVKNLASIFHTRIELRQIGVRDKAKMVGGLGICGRPFCCLKYEQDAYEDLLRTSPKPDSFVDTPEGRGTVVEVDLLRQRVKVRMEDSPETISLFSNADIAVLRNGKAKKNDPPIPADLAPISGSGKRVRQEEPKEEVVRLDPIRFRYSTESVVEENEEPIPEETAEEAKEGKSRSRRRRKPKAEAQKPEAPAKLEQPQKEKKEQPPKEDAGKEDSESSEESAKKSRNRNHYRRHRKPKPQNEG